MNLLRCVLSVLFILGTVACNEPPQVDPIAHLCEDGPSMACVQDLADLEATDEGCLRFVFAQSQHFLCKPVQECTCLEGCVQLQHATGALLICDEPTAGK
jgi:hypothetical protein